MYSLRDPSRSMKPAQGVSSQILDHVDSLIDELLNDSELSSSSLASILMAARESVRDGYHVALRGGSGMRITTCNCATVLASVTSSKVRYPTDTIGVTSVATRAFRRARSRGESASKAVGGAR